MKAHSRQPVGLAVAFVVLCQIALLSIAGSILLWVSDDFVIGGQVVGASHPRIVFWQSCFTLAGIISVLLAWFCHNRLRKAPVQAAHGEPVPPNLRSSS